MLPLIALFAVPFAPGSMIQISSDQASLSHDGAPALLYLNRCETGCVVSPGFEDSRQNTSSILDETIELSAFRHSDEDWERVVGCVRNLYAPFEIIVTTEDPGNAPHFEAFVAGYPYEAGFAGAGGVAPFTCGVIDNAITYTFANLYNGANQICNVVGQETAHAMGLDHELLACDPLTYLSGCPEKSFHDEDALCGEYEERPCTCGGDTQNTFQHLQSLFGPGEAPSVEILSPQSGSSVDGGFAVEVLATDDHAILEVQLRIDGRIVDRSSEAPYALRAPNTITPGVHTVGVFAIDDRHQQSSATVEILQDPCSSDNDCSNGRICSASLCILGPGSPGGLGDRCDINQNCDSNLCAKIDGQYGVCTSTCDLDPTGCPSGYSCSIAREGEQVCLATVLEEPETSGCSAGGRSAGPLYWILPLLFFWRRRRQPSDAF